MEKENREKSKMQKGKWKKKIRKQRKNWKLPLIGNNKLHGLWNPEV